jgi:hypothetical protein
MTDKYAVMIPFDGEMLFVTQWCREDPTRR